KRNNYRIFKSKRKNNDGKTVESKCYKIIFRDHLRIERSITAVSDKKASGHIADNIIEIMNLKIRNQSLTPQLQTFLANQPEKLRQKLTEWNILDANTNAGFERLVIFDKVKARHSKWNRYVVTGGHLFHFQESMQTDRLTQKHIEETITRVIKISESCKFIIPTDINGEAIKNFMFTLSKSGKSPRTVNKYLTSFKSFTIWMLKTGRLTANPIEYIQPMKEKKTRFRRPLTAQERQALLDTTIQAEKHHGLTGYERTLIYRLEYTTGLRWNAIYTLERRDFIIESNKPSVTIREENNKSRKQLTLSLGPDLAEELNDYFKLKHPTAKAFEGMYKSGGAKMIKADLKLAGIEYKNENGVADFHAQRHTFGTMLAQYNVPPVTRLRISITLTSTSMTKPKPSENCLHLNQTYLNWPKLALVMCLII
ncbi:MAG: tyrosine-type recombinase/integrase, partial [Planctomycetota bacterium]